MQMLSITLQIAFPIQFGKCLLNVCWIPGAIYLRLYSVYANSALQH